MSEIDVDCAINGGFKYNKKRKGAMDIFNDYIWHVNNDLWDYSKECYDNEGMLVTNIYDNVLEEI